jgi:hypothetical protein
MAGKDFPAQSHVRGGHELKLGIGIDKRPALEEIQGRRSRKEG